MEQKVICVVEILKEQYVLNIKTKQKNIIVFYFCRFLLKIRVLFEHQNLIKLFYENQTQDLNYMYTRMVIKTM